MAYLPTKYPTWLAAAGCAGVLAVCPLVAQEQAAVCCRFDGEEPGVEEVDTDPGLAVTVEDGEVRVAGTTADRNWRGDGIRLPFEDKGGAVQVSGKFRLAKRRASGLVCLGLETQRAGIFFLIFEWHPKRTVYRIQRSYLTIKSKVENGREAIPPNWNEESEYNTLNVRLDAGRKMAEFSVNDAGVDRVRFDEEVGKLLSVKLVLQTPAEGREFDVRFDDLSVTFN